MHLAVARKGCKINIAAVIDAKIPVTFRAGRPSRTGATNCHRLDALYPGQHCAQLDDRTRLLIHRRILPPLNSAPSATLPQNPQSNPKLPSTTKWAKQCGTDRISITGNTKLNASIDDGRIAMDIDTGHDDHARSLDLRFPAIRPTSPNSKESKAGAYSITPSVAGSSRPRARAIKCGPE